MKQFDEEFNQELNEQKEEMNKIIEDFQKVLASNKIVFDPSLNVLPQKVDPKEKTTDSKTPVVANSEFENPSKKQEKDKKSASNEIKYPVSLKSLNSNQYIDPMYREVVKKTMETNQVEHRPSSNTSNQNLSQKVNSLITENKERKKTQTQKFISKN